jgi:hypothetical protein
MMECVESCLESMFLHESVLESAAGTYRVGTSTEYRSAGCILHVWGRMGKS